MAPIKTPLELNAKSWRRPDGQLHKTGPPPKSQHSQSKEGTARQAAALFAWQIPSLSRHQATRSGVPRTRRGCSCHDVRRQPGRRCENNDAANEGCSPKRGGRRLLGSRCNVASTLVAKADTTGVHGLPMTKPKYLASSARHRSGRACIGFGQRFRGSDVPDMDRRKPAAAGFVSATARGQASSADCPAYRPPHSKRQINSWMVVRSFGSMQASKFPYA